VFPAVENMNRINGEEDARSVEIDDDGTMSERNILMKAQIMEIRDGKRVGLME
jgi:hypothetical protein